MNTPIFDFLKKYTESGAKRFHMPGHKGKNFLGFEEYDLTEIEGADSLYDKSGIIEESERIASALFGTPTYYSTEGSSHAIRAMLALFLSYTKKTGKEPLIYAPRNVHKSFVSAAALLDISVTFIENSGDSPYLSSTLTPSEFDLILSKAEKLPSALYLTSPDYLGNIANVKGFSEVCKKYSMLLLVDNAHGAYLHFLRDKCHPIDLGADMAADSAHKTLPALTGAAYLHLSRDMNELMKDEISETLLLFGSTSPSYLTLSSLDLLNSYLSDYSERLSRFLPKVRKIKASLLSHGYTLIGDEELKITLSTKEFGYLGTEMAERLSSLGIVAEFADRDNLVLMLTPENNDSEIEELENALLSFDRRNRVEEQPPKVQAPSAVMGIREAVFKDKERLSVGDAIGRVVSSLAVSCPPAVPIVVSGELLTKEMAKALEYYGVKHIFVVK